MPRYNVTCGNGKWACYTTISDGFLTPFMPRDEYEKWRIEEYGKDVGPLEEANVMDLQMALRKMRLNHRDNAEFIRGLWEAGLIYDDGQ